MSGPAHLPYLVVSLRTLRDHWSGPIEIGAYPESYLYVKKIALDQRIDAKPILVEPGFRTKNSQFIHKIQFMQRGGCEKRLYLDADTTIHKTLNPLLQMLDGTTFVATQFNHWTTKGSVMQQRLKRLLPYESMAPFVQKVLDDPYPSVNGGIFCCRPFSPVLDTWYRWSMDSRAIFICDECVLHLMQVVYGEHHFKIMLKGAYNCSHKYQRKAGLKQRYVAVFHYHGDSCVRPQKSPHAVAMWKPLFEECLDMDLGGMQSWIEEVKPLNRHMRENM